MVASIAAASGLNGTTSAAVWGRVVTVQSIPGGRAGVANDCCAVTINAGPNLSYLPEDEYTVRFYRFTPGAPVDLCIPGVLPVGRFVRTYGYLSNRLILGDVETDQFNIIGQNLTW